MIWEVIWYCLFIEFTIADVITSLICAEYGLREANPLMAPFFDSIIEMKLIALVVALVVVIVYNRMYHGDGWVPLAIGTCATFAAVMNNVLLPFLQTI